MSAYLTHDDAFLRDPFANEGARAMLAWFASNECARPGEETEDEKTAAAVARDAGLPVPINPARALYDGSLVFMLHPARKQVRYRLTLDNAAQVRSWVWKYAQLALDPRGVALPVHMRFSTDLHGLFFDIDDLEALDAVKATDRSGKFVWTNVLEMVYETATAVVRVMFPDTAHVMGGLPVKVFPPPADRHPTMWTRYKGNGRRENCVRVGVHLYFPNVFADWGTRDNIRAYEVMCDMLQHRLRVIYNAEVTVDMKPFTQLQGHGSLSMPIAGKELGHTFTRYHPYAVMRGMKWVSGSTVAADELVAHTLLSTWGTDYNDATRPNIPRRLKLDAFEQLCRQWDYTPLPPPGDESIWARPMIRRTLTNDSQDNVSQDAAPPPPPPVVVPQDRAALTPEEARRMRLDVFRNAHGCDIESTRREMDAYLADGIRTETDVSNKFVELLNKFNCYVVSEAKVAVYTVDPRTTRPLIMMLTLEHWRAYMTLSVRMPAPKDALGKITKRATTVYAKNWLLSQFRTSVLRVVFVPDGASVENLGVPTQPELNLYRGSYWPLVYARLGIAEPSKEIIGAYLHLLYSACGNSMEQMQHVLDIFSLKARLPGRLISKFVYFVGYQGSGKSMLATVSALAIGGPDGVHTFPTMASRYQSGFSAPGTPIVVIIDEGKKGDLIAFGPSLRTDVTSQLSMKNEKYRAQYVSGNFALLIVCGNEPMDVPAGGERRQILCAGSNNHVGDEAYFQRTAELLLPHDSLAQIHHFLATRQITPGFTPERIPPGTVTASQVTWASMGQVQRHLLTLLVRKLPLDGTPYISGEGRVDVYNSVVHLSKFGKVLDEHFPLRGGATYSAPALLNELKLLVPSARHSRTDQDIIDLPGWEDAMMIMETRNPGCKALALHQLQTVPRTPDRNALLNGTYNLVVPDATPNFEGMNRYEADNALEAAVPQFAPYRQSALDADVCLGLLGPFGSRLDPRVATDIKNKSLARRDDTYTAAIGFLESMDGDSDVQRECVRYLRGTLNQAAGEASEIVGRITTLDEAMAVWRKHLPIPGHTGSEDRPSVLMQLIRETADEDAAEAQRVALRATSFIRVNPRDRICNSDDEPEERVRPVNPFMEVECEESHDDGEEGEVPKRRKRLRKGKGRTDLPVIQEPVAQRDTDLMSPTADMYIQSDYGIGGGGSAGPAEVEYTPGVGMPDLSSLLGNSDFATM